MASQQPKSTLKSAGVLMIILVSATISLWVWHKWRSEPGNFAAPHLSPQGNAEFVTTPQASPEAGERAKLENVRRVLAGITVPNMARAQLDELRRYLSTLQPKTAVDVIGRFLDSRQDTPTGLGFAIGPDGFLTAAPSLRVFLLDYLAHVDRQAASRYAEAILSSMNSPDEWAVSLRNYALGNPTTQASAFLEQKMQKLLRYEPWQSNPSSGYLEAFDVAVYLGSTNLIPALGQLVRRTDNSAVARAAYLALDRLTIQEPAAVLDELQNEPALMQGREATRANYFARANVQDPHQKAILESYLLDPQRSAAELQTFAGIYPSGNYMVSHNLLTQTSTPTGAEMAARDAAALRVVADWLRDSRFANVQSHLQSIRERLEQFVNRPIRNER